MSNFQPLLQTSRAFGEHWSDGDRLAKVLFSWPAKGTKALLEPLKLPQIKGYFETKPKPSYVITFPNITPGWVYLGLTLKMNFVEDR